MLKTLNKALSPVRIVVEEGHATIRTHGASPKLNPILKEIVEALKAGELSVAPGVYRVDATRERLFRIEYNLRLVE